MEMYGSDLFRKFLISRVLIRRKRKKMKIRNQVFDTDNNTYIMGILNVTPDSFSDGGKYTKTDVILKRVEKMISEGADIIDVGGESTRPGYQQISDQEEQQRVIPVIEHIRKEFDIPISLDTYKSSVAKMGINAGADIINDIWGLQYDNTMAKVIADSKVACVLMHNRKQAEYQNFLEDIAADFSNILYKARQAGIDEDRIILDPGVGFAKSLEQNLLVINNLHMFHVFGVPLLLGVSRKSVIGETLLLPVEDRLEGTLATSIIAFMQRCAFIRVHDVKENKRAIQMAKAIRDV